MDQKTPSDEDLVSRTLGGNQEAFGCLFDRHAPMVRAVVGAVSMDWPSVEDMTQETFLRAYRSLPKLLDPNRFGVWIVGIARLVARERKRSLHRDRHEFIGDPMSDIQSSVDEETEIEKAELLALVMENLATLPERERVAIHAFFLTDRNVQQAAEALKLSRSGFYGVLKKGMAKLTTLMQTQDRAGGAKGES